MNYAWPSLVIVALLAGAGWFYFEEYQPLTVTAANLTTQNQTLSSDLASAKAQIATLNHQIKDLTDERDATAVKLKESTAQNGRLALEITQLKSQNSQLASQINLLHIALSGDPNVNFSYTPPDPLPQRPNWNWSVNGIDYHNVVITKVEADCVHITYDGGLGSVNIADLDPDIQKMLNYNPQAAAAVSRQKSAALARADTVLSAQTDYQGQLKALQDQLAADQAALASARKKDADLRAQINIQKNTNTNPQIQQQIDENSAILRNYPAKILKEQAAIDAILAKPVP
jgi:peptidoglycan hydrolase CwlO-like protein